MCIDIYIFISFGKMAASGKKGKKNKGTVISLQSFLSNGDTPVGTTQVAKKLRNVDGDDSDDGSSSLPLVYQLPSAPRASRICDDDSIPHKPPFIAYVTNLPFDIHDDDIHDFFAPMPLISIRLPREDGETGRVRGFGYIELETREDLINALSMPDPCIKGRRIRIDLSNEQEQQNRQKGYKRIFDGFSNNENRESTNWRRDNQNAEFGSHGHGYERGNRENRERKVEESEAAGSWRVGSRPNPMDVTSRNDHGTHRVPNMRNAMGDREKIYPSESALSVDERPKLNLKPRTLPLPENAIKIESEQTSTDDLECVKPVKLSGGVASEKVFGSAKPVDTASRELEIEERLAEVRRKEKFQFELEEAELSEKLESVNLKNNIKDSENSVVSWRSKTVSTANNSEDDSEKQTVSSHDDKKQDGHDGEFSRQKTREKHERSKLNSARDSKIKDDNKIRRDTKNDRLLPKQLNQSEPVVHSSNKYSGLNDDVSD